MTYLHLPKGNSHEPAVGPQSSDPQIATEDSDQGPRSIDEILEERGKSHGDYDQQAALAQNMYDATVGHDWERLTPAQRNSLYMIFVKISRIATGDAEVRDHWDDIAGYAKLAADRCSK